MSRKGAGGLAGSSGKDITCQIYRAVMKYFLTIINEMIKHDGRNRWYRDNTINDFIKFLNIFLYCK